MRPAVLEPIGPDRYRFAGDWCLPDLARISTSVRALAAQPGTSVILDLSQLGTLDTAGAWLLLRAQERLAHDAAAVRLEGLGERQGAILEVVRSNRPTMCPLPSRHPPALERIGRYASWQAASVLGFLVFLGETAEQLARATIGRGRIYGREVLHVLETAGANAIPIIGLLSFLIGVVICYQSLVQLTKYGADVFVVDLVAISTLRELAPLITAIIIAGRTGSAFTAEIGAMKITEEIDALRVLGISPGELLVIPKILALLIAVPLLTLFADVAGLLGGMLMAQAYGAISTTVFMERLPEAIDLSTLLTGLGKTPVFAVIIAAVGCYQGFQVEHGADAVGRRTTISVVESIFMVILADALFSVVFSFLDI